MAQQNPKLKKWLKWMNKIRIDVSSLVAAHDVFCSIDELFSSNQQLNQNSLVLWYLRNTYAAYAAMCVRRHLKTKKDSISLARLLDELAEAPSKVSRAYFREVYTSVPIQAAADAFFDRFCSAAGELHISSQLVRSDLELLRRTAVSCEDLADRRIAHLDKRGLKCPPDVKKLAEVIDCLHKICLKYHRLFCGDDLSSLLPECSDNWMAVFDIPWRKPQHGP